MKPQPTLERIWTIYLVAAGTVTLGVVGSALARGLPLSSDQRFKYGCHLAVHAGLLVAVLGVRWVAMRRSHDAARGYRLALGLVGLPIVFSAMAWVLPAVHPEPYEYQWLQWDRALFGADFARLADRWLTPWSVELLQLVYAAFYLLPIVSALAARVHSGRAAFDRALATIIGSFLASYLGYLLVPTLAPKVVLAHAAEVEGLWFTAALRQSIDAAEANPWDCFPSGHTMLTIISLLLAWRWSRACFWLMLPIAVLLIASTLLLRYHWATDVIAGALLAWPCVKVCDLLMDRDAWPAVPGNRGDHSSANYSSEK